MALWTPDFRAGYYDGLNGRRRRARASAGYRAGYSLGQSRRGRGRRRGGFSRYRRRSRR